MLADEGMKDLRTSFLEDLGQVHERSICPAGQDEKFTEDDPGEERPDERRILQVGQNNNGDALVREAEKSTGRRHRQV
jgi:hypothetical protein